MKEKCEIFYLKELQKLFLKLFQHTNSSENHVGREIACGMVVNMIKYYYVILFKRMCWCNVKEIRFFNSTPETLIKCKWFHFKVKCCLFNCPHFLRTYTYFKVPVATIVTTCWCKGKTNI